MRFAANTAIVNGFRN